jgi:hypothetical protein
MADRGGDGVHREKAAAEKEGIQRGAKLMWKAIPWDTLGPAALAAAVILILVFGFILKFQKGSKNLTPTNPPMDITTVSKKTLCVKHEGEISSNKTAIGIFGAALQEANRVNSDAHGKLFDKLEAQGKEIITEIKKVNGIQ